MRFNLASFLYAIAQTAFLTYLVLYARDIVSIYCGGQHVSRRCVFGDGQDRLGCYQ